VRNSCTHQGGETKIKLWGVALLGCALNCKTRVGGHAVGSFAGRGPRVWGPAKGLRPAGQCYPACHAVASSRLFCVLDAAILCLLSPCPSVSISLSICSYPSLSLCLASMSCRVLLFFACLVSSVCHCQLICNFWHNDFKLSNRK